MVKNILRLGTGGGGFNFDIGTGTSKMNTYSCMSYINLQPIKACYDLCITTDFSSLHCHSNHPNSIDTGNVGRSQFYVLLVYLRIAELLLYPCPPPLSSPMHRSLPFLTSEENGNEDFKLL